MRAASLVDFCPFVPADVKLDVPHSAQTQAALRTFANSLKVRYVIAVQRGLVCLSPRRRVT